MKNKGSKIILTIVFAGILVFGASFARAQTSNEEMIKMLQSLVQVLMQMVTQLKLQLTQKLTTDSTITQTPSTTSPQATILNINPTTESIIINRAVTLSVAESPTQKILKVIDSNFQTLYTIVITPQTKLKIGNITDSSGWSNIGLPKPGAEPKNWYDLEWSKFPLSKSDHNTAIIKVSGKVKSSSCGPVVDADTVYFYSINIDPGCPMGQ